MRKTRSVAVLSALFLVLGMVMAAPAFATSCSVDTDGVVLSVVMDEATTIVRDATDKIKVSDTSGEVVCSGGWPYTVFDIDSVDVTGTGTLTLDMSGGAFGPGFSSELGTDEIEFHLESDLSLILNGTSAADNWDFGAGEDTDPRGVGLNGDSDADIMGGTAASPANLTLAALTANGLAGNDTFEEVSNATTETVNGGLGTDTVTYEDRTVAVTVTIGGGADDGQAAPAEGDNIAGDVETVIGGAGADNISVLPSTSILKYRLEGGAENDTLTGADGRDSFFGEAGNDTLNGGGNRDFLNGGVGTDTENGGTGNDVFDQERDSNGGDAMAGGAGTDTVKYSLRTTGVVVTIGAGANNDGACVDATCASSNEGDSVADDVEVVFGGREKDILTATTTTVANEPVVYKLNGAGGNDTLTGGGNRDKLLGGANNDTLKGNGGGDYLSGSSGNDTMLGGAGDDTLSGGSDDDTMNGEAGSDKVTGSSGADSLWGDGDITPTSKDTLVGGSEPSGQKDKCEVDPKDARSGCEGKLQPAAAPTS